MRRNIIEITSENSASGIVEHEDQTSINCKPQSGQQARVNKVQFDTQTLLRHKLTCRLTSPTLPCLILYCTPPDSHPPRTAPHITSSDLPYLHTSAAPRALVTALHRITPQQQLSFQEPLALNPATRDRPRTCIIHSTFRLPSRH